MEEIWKMISGYEYEISNFGKVRNVDGELSELLCDKVGEPRNWATMRPKDKPLSTENNSRSCTDISAIKFITSS